MASRKEEHFTATRATVHSTKSFEEILSKLYESIGTPEDTAIFPNLVIGTLSGTEDRSSFATSVEKLIGPHGFMIIRDFDHSSWVSLLNGGGTRMKRVQLGNPILAAQKLIKRDMTSALLIPFDLLVLEKSEVDGGGVDLIYQVPGDLIAGLNDDPIVVETIQLMDAKLAKLTEYVAS